MSDTKLKVEIQTVATGGGAAKAAEDIKKVTKATKDASQATGEGSKATSQFDEALNALGSRQSAAKDVIEGTSAALKGNTDALFGTAKAAKNLIEVFSLSSPVAKFASILALIGTAAFALKDKLLPAKEALTGTGEEAAEAAKKIADVDEAKLDFERHTAELARLRSSFESTRKQADLLFTAEERLRDAKLGLTIAKIDQAETAQLSQKGLSDGQRALIEAQAEAARTTARATAEKEKSDAALVKIQNDLTALYKHRAETEAKVDQAASDQNAFAADAARIKARAGDLGIKSDQQRELEELQRLQSRLRETEGRREELKKLPDISSAAGAASPFSGATSNGPLDIVSRQVVELRQQVADLQARAAQNTSVINAGKETFEGAKIAADKKLREAQERVSINPNEENRNLLEQATEGAELAKKIGEAEAQRNAAFKNAAEIVIAGNKDLQETNQQIQIKESEASAARIDAQTSRISGANDIRKADTKIRDASFPRFGEGAGALKDAADEIKSTPAVDGTPLSEAAGAISEAVKASAEKSTAAITDSAAAISTAAAALPPPIDVEPIRAALEGYHGNVVALYTEGQQRAERLEQRVNRISQQLANLRSA